MTWHAGIERVDGVSARARAIPHHPSGRACAKLNAHAHKPYGAVQQDRRAHTALSSALSTIALMPVR